MPKISRAGWLMLLATMSWGGAAHAAGADAERLKTAAEEFDAGRRAYKIRDYENSAVHFENADRDAPSPEALQSAMRARKEAGQAARAATLAALGLSRYPREVAFGNYARQVLADVEKTLARVIISCRPNCTVIVDNKVMPFPESATALVYLDPGRHTVIADWPNDRNKSVEVLATAGEATQLAFQGAAVAEKTTLDRLPIPVQSEPRASETATLNNSVRLPTYVFFVDAGLTAVLLGVTVWSGIDTVNNPGKDAIVRNCAPPNNNTSCPDYQVGLSHQHRTNVLIAVTGVAGLSTAILGLFFTDWASGANKAGRAPGGWQPVVGLNDGVSVGAVGSF